MNRMPLATLNKVASSKSTCDQWGYVLGGPSGRSTNRVMAPQERARVVPAAQRDVADGGQPEQDDEYDEVDAGITATSGAAGATLKQWVDAVDFLAEVGGLVAENRRGATPMVWRFDFTAQAVPQTAQPLPLRDEPGYPQEIVNRLPSFRAAKILCGTW